jgi:hypothetical protein
LQILARDFPVDRGSAEVARQTLPLAFQKPMRGFPTERRRRVMPDNKRGQSGQSGQGQQKQPNENPSDQAKNRKQQQDRQQDQRDER